MINLCFITLTVAMLLQSVGTQIARSSAEPSNKKQEVAVVKQKAESGDAGAQVQLGLAYASGDGVAPDESEAVRWFRKAADQGYAAGEYFLGEMYASGRGVLTNNTEALEWIRRAAEHGDARGQFNLAAMYTQGIGIAKDDTEAARWMRKAADQGFAPGQFGIGVMYAHGKGVPEDASEAVKWYRKAGEQGEANALNNLALLLATSKDANIRSPNEAIGTALKAVDAERENPGYVDTLATAYYEAGQYEKAVDAERRALALSPDNPSYRKALEKYLAAVGAKH
jgi:TPR repeat protein